MHIQKQTRTSSRALSRLALVPAVLAVSLLAGCFGDDAEKSKGATQAAARVNDNEVTVHQINMVLERQPGLKPDQADAAGRQILEGLIDQELAVQKAEESKLDRDPKIVQMLDASRRQILARAYYEKASTTAITPPALDEIQKYFNENPGLFANRRIYMLQEFTIQGTAEETKALQAQLEAAGSVQGFAEALKGSGLKFAVNQVTQPAESLPLALVGRIAELKDGQALYEQGQGGMKAVLVVASRPQPLTFEQSKPLIERFLTETKRSEWLRAHVKELRTAAKVEYVGRFAEKPAAAASGAASATAPAAEVAPAVAPTVDPAASAASAMDGQSIDKGLSGLK